MFTVDNAINKTILSHNNVRSQAHRIYSKYPSIFCDVLFRLSEFLTEVVKVHLKFLEIRDHPLQLLDFWLEQTI